MLSGHAILLLLTILVGLLIGLMMWGVYRARIRKVDSAMQGSRDDVLLGLMVLAAFSLGIFLTYALVGLNI
jgi:hypothetical protein